MKRALALVALLLAFGLMAAESGPDLEIDVRYLNQRTQTDTLAQTLLYREPVFPWLTLSAGARFWEATSFVDGMSYMGQMRIAVPGAEWLGAVLRLEQINRLSDSTTGTCLLGALDLRGAILPGFGAYAALGYYKVFHSLSRSVPVPTFSDVSFTDADLATELGLWAHPLDRWLVRTGLGTYEAIDVYNLNNPFVEARVEHTVGEEDWIVSAFARYQLLLGFGRSDNLTFGVGLRREW